MRLVLVAAAALIDEAGHILVTQRPPGKAMAGLWEFPGGKIEAGETPEVALCRELFEEIGVTVDPATPEPLTFASHTYDDFHLMMPLFAVRRWTGTPRTKEVADLKFVAPLALSLLEMPAADAPLVQFIQSIFTDISAT
ncbi:(deoxy)nucleoside triphosphate pyrophosphohydrolase [Acuticoccus sp. I52.16.1]|uniref:(deoxy)nucleoside triphosphate pyrophosphohydrolase n=1 Tax=Acuticoccus sp. I52.16.1 TaxID=2928472 RepID=UPI001FD5EFD7|nr:(deoxy)nucleoside triphosphate pyrophosphohydrolase [Acuticoccus sp. I52.16.1]UOM33213.1 (deoxy)nucleoside triphosphate pyrophosphohydrolase [Acuticoccus sp. I52.16.1]